MSTKEIFENLKLVLKTNSIFLKDPSIIREYTFEYNVKGVNTKLS